MQVGPMIPQSGPQVTRDLVLNLARSAEDSGFDALWVNDHVVYPREFKSPYPYSPTGQPPGRVQVEGHILEALTLLTFAAAVTSRVQLGTAVLVLPMRQPVYHAKVMATLDHLAGGRFILGAGLGWAKEEFEVLDVDFARRGARFDEQIELMRRLWTEEWVDGFHGEFYEVDGWTCRPHPPRGIPIWLGGESPQQLRRAGRFGDGWLTHGDRIPRLAPDIERIHEAAREAGRDPAGITIAVTGVALLRSDRLEFCAERLHAAKEAGVDHATLGTHPAELHRAPELVEQFAARYLKELQAS